MKLENITKKIMAEIVKAAKNQEEETYIILMGDKVLVNDNIGKNHGEFANSEITFKNMEAAERAGLIEHSYPDIDTYWVK